MNELGRVTGQVAGENVGLGDPKHKHRMVGETDMGHSMGCPWGCCLAPASKSVSTQPHSQPCAWGTPCFASLPLKWRQEARLPACLPPLLLLPSFLLLRPSPAWRWCQESLSTTPQCKKHRQQSTHKGVGEGQKQGQSRKACTRQQ